MFTVRNDCEHYFLEAYMSNKEYPYARMSPITVMEDFPIGTVIKRNNCLLNQKGEPYEETVQGYIFDGEYWFPAYDTWDGWYPYRGDDGDETYTPETKEETQFIEDWLSMMHKKANKTRIL